MHACNFFFSYMVNIYCQTHALFYTCMKYAFQVQFQSMNGGK